MKRHTEGPWGNTTPTTALAIEIRSRLGKHNNPAKPVVDLVERVVEVNADLLAACRALVECSPCQNGCAVDDMTCATRKAEAAIDAATEESEEESGCEWHQ